MQTDASDKADTSKRLLRNAGAAFFLMNYYCPRIPRISNDRYTGAADVAIYVKKHVHAPRLEDT